ncbi:MAG TPA: efflux RND transporter periplasmic adaptor subunit [Vicinamibacterales bacterium]|nr:efflux RND transporter periplasmic adaptor subunit [Vicinamibacterales bacterium]
MSGASQVTMHKGAAALIGSALVLVGAGAGYLLMRSSAGGSEQMGGMPAGTATGTPAAGAQPPAASTAPNTGSLPDVVVSLTAEAVERAGIVVTPVAPGTSAGEIRLPGVVEPNAYRQVAVTPLVAGRVTRVSVELGASVRPGQTLAQIYSPELAEAQTKYVSATARLDAHDRELQRTQKLVEIGAASRQELERIHAEHAAQTAAVQSARSQLELLGVPASTIDALGSGSHVNATTTVPAPIAGVITERAANVGLNVDQATALFTVVDLSVVWIVADVYESDFSRVRVGSDATIATAAYPGVSLRGRVSYIDPQMNPETRTARVRVEVPNPRGELRLGMYADVVVTGAPGTSMAVIPRSAIQNVGDRTVVYLADPQEPGTFTEREVRLGRSFGGQVEVVSGVQPGDAIVSEGSFFVRAERERLGLRPATATVNPTAGPEEAKGTELSDDVQVAKVVVNEQGFEPAQVALRAGSAARITFLRTTDKTCATEVVFPSLDIKRALPLNEPVVIEFTPAKTEEIAFACGMNMLRGTVVVQ